MTSISVNPPPEFRPVTRPAFPQTPPSPTDVAGFRSAAQLGLHEFVRILLRRKGLILASTVVFSVIAALIAFQLTPLFRANAILMLDARKTNVIDVQAVVSGLPPEMAAVRSELDVITSRALASRVVDRLRLQNNPEFNAQLAPKDWFAGGFSSLLSLIPDEVKALWSEPESAPEEIPPEELAAAEREAVISAVVGNLGVQNTPQSYTISLGFASRDPKTAAAVANAYADEYLLDQLEAKFEKTSQANDWLSQRLESLKQKVQVAERAVEAFRSKSDLIKSGQSTVAQQQLSELNTQLVLARTERAQAEARLRSAQEGVRSPERIAAVADVLASPLIQRLREQESTVRRREAELSSRYGAQHPTMINNRAELKDLQAKIIEEVQKIIQGLANQVSIARAKERSLADSLGDLERRSAENLRSEVGLRELEREAEASRTLYEHFLSRFKETSEQQGSQQSDARIISRASTPVSPVFPKKKLIVGGGAVLGLLLGVMIALLIEHLLRGLYDIDQVERVTGHPGLGIVPRLNGFRAVRAHDYVVDRPTSAYSERIRTVQTGIQFADVDNPPKVVMVTSALPKEGKTTFCVSLARLMASSGNKVLLIDCDLRRPGVAKLLPDHGGGHIADVAHSNVDPKDLIQVDDRSGLHYIVARPGTPNPQELLGSKRMERFISGVAQAYDMVLIDTPPVKAVSDTAPISRLVDATLFLARWAETPRDTVTGALKQLTSYGAKIAGVALTRVDMKKYSTYGDNYRQYEYYYRS